MLKTFAAALAPILALAQKGTGSGLDQANAGQIELIPGRLNLYTYNNWNGTTDEFHGDLSWTIAKPVAPQTLPAAADQQTQWVEFGFCMRNAATAATKDSVWDCVETRADILNKDASDAAKTTTWSQTFTVTDVNYTGAAVPTSINSLTIVDDADATVADPAVSWLNVPTLSSKTACAVAVASPATYWCQELDSHFYRNFIAKDTKDAQLADPADKWQMMGWTATYPTANWGGAPTVRFGSIITVTGKVVYQTYIDKKAADIKKIADDKAAADAAAAAKKKDATSMTTCAAALFATMYALSF